MRRRIIMCVLPAVLAIGVNCVWAWAEDDGGQKTMEEGGWRAAGMMMPPPDEMAVRMAGRLKLSKEQQAKVKALLTAEREKTVPLVRNMLEYRRQLHETAHAVKFNEAAIRAIAAKKAQAEVELIVSRERVRNQINSLLTPEQKVIADAFPPPPFHHGRGHERGCGSDQRFDRMPPPPPCNGDGMHRYWPGDDECGRQFPGPNCGKEWG